MNLEVTSILQWLVDHPTYETEYAHRMETCCRGCDHMEVNGKIKHARHCIVRRAQKLETVDISDIPEADETFFKNAKLRRPMR